MKAPQPEFSRTLVVEKIPQSGLEQKLTANDAERQSLCERFGLLELPKLTATLTVTTENNKAGVNVAGTLSADVVQQCVVTLEPLPAHIEETIDILCIEAEAEDAPGAPTLIAAEEDEIEPIVNGVIDLGELVAQHRGAALDPYPRKPGVAFVEAEYGGKGPDGNPFAKLA